MFSKVRNLLGGSGWVVGVYENKLPENQHGCILLSHVPPVLCGKTFLCLKNLVPKPKS